MIYQYERYEVAFQPRIILGTKAISWSVKGYDLPYDAEGKTTRQEILASGTVDSANSWETLHGVAKQNAEDFIDAYRTYYYDYDYRGQES